MSPDKNPKDAEGLVEIEANDHEVSSQYGMSPLLYFTNLVFRDGLNITVRKGDKWHDTRGLVEAADVNDDDSGPVVTLNVLETFLIPFSELGEGHEYHAFLEFEHDPKCCNVYSLLQVMKELYPAATPATQGGFTTDDQVTVVLFTVVPISED